MSNAADLVSIIGPNGESSTQDGSTDGNSSTIIGLITNSRLQAYNGTAWDRLRLDSTGNLHVTDVGSNEFQANVLSVVTPGTRVQLPSFVCRQITILARISNTGSVYVGGANVSSTVFGAQLQARDSFTFNLLNSDKIWIDAQTAGEGISYVIT